MKILFTFLIIMLSVPLNSQVSRINDDMYLFSETNQEINCTKGIMFSLPSHENTNSEFDFGSTEFIWPFLNELDDGLILANYVDNLPGVTMKDYMGNSWSYEDHHGTDIAINSFREMDRFVSIRAAESGTVTNIAFNNFDRNTVPAGSANFVIIRHNDGSSAYYYHLMKNSVTVSVGEYVQKGSLIGYAGSSGSSTAAHLHFEVLDIIGGMWTTRDPWHGTYNTLPSMWENQYAYVGDREFKAFDMGVYTAASVGGNINNASNYLKEKILQPVSISGYESKIGVWVQFQGKASGKQMRVEIRRPSGSLLSSSSYTISSNKQFVWFWWTPNFNVGVSQTGNWYARVLFDGVEQLRDYFNVQSVTTQQIRLYPAAGKCFRVSSFVQRDTLRIRPVTANLRYELLNSPSNITLTNDSILLIDTLKQTYRVREFKVIGSAGGSTILRDTMIYKLIDPTKSNLPGNSVSLELRALIEGFWDGTGMVEDTVTVFLHSSSFPFELVDSARIKLNTDGKAIVSFANASPGTYYYIALKHRNSIETWSKTIELFTFGFPAVYDFTNSRTKSYGDNMKYKEGKYCFYSGDVNQNGSVDLADVTLVFNKASDFTPQNYEPTDVNGDNYTDLDDVLTTYNNSTAFVVMMHP